MLFQGQIPTIPFKNWLREDPENRRLLWVSAGIMLVSFAWLKFLYPYPNFMPPDSNSYIEAAFKNQTINMWAIGYSKFLRLVSSFTSSDFLLVLIQYLLLQASVLYFLFTIRYLVTPGKWVFRILVIANVANPLLPHISNFVGSDTLFATLSLVWITQLLWILYSPNRNMLAFHAAILLFAFMVRYNALYYPLISIAVILWAKNMNFRAKAAGISLILILIGWFIGRTTYQYYKVENTVQFSAFGGWEMAANALYGYAYAKPDVPETLPVRFRALHILVNHHMDSIRQLSNRPDADVGVYYLWDAKSPLKIYMENQSKKDTISSYFKKWATMAPLYSEYGRYLIERHTGAFLKHYAWPNLINYYAPPTFFMGMYNLGLETVDPLNAAWFGWKDTHVSTYSKNKNISVTSFFPTLLSIINPIFILSILGFLAISGFRKLSTYYKQIAGLLAGIWFCNMTFSVLSAPIELRYQLFPMIITFSIETLLIAFIINTMKPNS